MNKTNKKVFLILTILLILSTQVKQISATSSCSDCSECERCVTITTGKEGNENEYDCIPKNTGTCTTCASGTCKCQSGVCVDSNGAGSNGDYIIDVKLATSCSGWKSAGYGYASLYVCYKEGNDPPYLEDVTYHAKHPSTSCTGVATCPNGYNKAGNIYVSNSKICYWLCKKTGSSPKVIDIKYQGKYSTTNEYRNRPTCPTEYKEQGIEWDGTNYYFTQLCVKKGSGITYSCTDPDEDDIKTAETVTYEMKQGTNIIQTITLKDTCALPKDYLFSEENPNQLPTTINSENGDSIDVWNDLLAGKYGQDDPAKGAPCKKLIEWTCKDNKPEPIIHECDITDFFASSNQKYGCLDGKCFWEEDILSDSAIYGSCKVWSGKACFSGMSSGSTPTTSGPYWSRCSHHTDESRTSQCEPCFVYCSDQSKPCYRDSPFVALPWDIGNKECWTKNHCNPNYPPCTPAVKLGYSKPIYCNYNTPYCVDNWNGYTIDTTPEVSICHMCDFNKETCSFCNGAWVQPNQPTGTVGVVEGGCCDTNFYDDYKKEGGVRESYSDCGKTFGNVICDAMDYSYLDPTYISSWTDSTGHPTGVPKEKEPLLREGGKWLDASNDVIKTLKCDNINYLFDNQNWLESKGDCSIVNVNGHEFLDLRSSSESSIQQSESYTPPETYTQSGSYSPSKSYTPPENYPEGAGDFCDDGFCNGVETCSSCPQDCGTCPPEPVRDTKFGIMYSLWHCHYTDNPTDISECVAGRQQWNSIPLVHWWDEPALGYYCLATDDHVVASHAVMLRDAGIDFVFLDVTNHPYTGDESGVDPRAYEDILDPLDNILRIWSTIPGSPRVVPWVSIPQVDNGQLMINAILEKLEAYPEMRFEFLGRYLILGGNPEDNDVVRDIESRGYISRDMWAIPENDERWSFLSWCRTPGFKESQGTIPCNQRVAVRDGKVEQVSIAAAYQVDFMSNTENAVPKFYGRTFRRQFETLFDNPDAPIATITGWNEWHVRRWCYPWVDNYTPDWCCDENGCKEGFGFDEWANGNKIFVDQWDMEYSRDIEPAKNEMGDYYVRLMKSCISLHKQGKRCDSSTANELCCKDYYGSSSPTGNVVTDFNSVTGSAVGDIEGENEKYINSTWAECAGNDVAYNDESTGGKVFFIGEQVSCGNTIYFCSSENKWITDLDITNKETCEAAGFVWIGPSDTEGYCCGDDGFDDTFGYYQPYGDACFRGQVIYHCEERTLNKISYNFGVLNKIVGFGVENSQSGFDNLVIMDQIYGNILYKNNFSESSQIQNFQSLSGTWQIQNGEYIGTRTNGFGISLIPWNLTNGIIKFTLNTKPIIPAKNGLIVFGFVDINNFWYAAIRPDIDSIELGQVVNGNKYILSNETINLPNQDLKIRVETQDNYVSLLVILEKINGAIVNENGILSYCSDNGENYCETRCSQYFCSYETSNWEYYYGEPRDKASTWPGTLPENGIKTECCEQSQCWNGTFCITDQSNDPKAKPYEKWRCVNGEWTEALLKYTWDLKEEGYCPKIDQCLVNPYSVNTNFNNAKYLDIDNPLNNDIQCINDKEYIGDHYCEDGVWTTRTKLIALQLLDITENSYDPNDYVLFCDSYQNTLNYYDYEIVTNYGTNKAMDYIIKQNNKCLLLDKPVPCVNKFCILKFKKTYTDVGVAIGTSLNNEINNPNNYSILELFGKNTAYCDTVINNNDGQFHYCDPSHDTWYNNKIKSIIYSKDAVNLQEVLFWQKFLQFLKNPFNNIFDIIVNVIKPKYPGGAEYDYDFIYKTKDFDKIYLSRKDTKSIKGVIEKIKDKQFLSVTYEGFNINICPSVNTYWMKNPAQGFISCNVSNNIYYVQTERPARMDIWQDLTSKLRIRKKGIIPPTPECQLLSAQWTNSAGNKVTQTNENDLVYLQVTGDSLCNGLTVSYKIYEDDLWPAPDDYIQPDPISATFTNSVAKTTWTAKYLDDGLLGGDPEFYFKSIVAELEIKSDNLKVIKTTVCTPGTCDYNSRIYCTNLGVWSSIDSIEYCNNCPNHCSDNNCNCQETSSTCSQDCGVLPPTGTHLSISPSSTTINNGNVFTLDIKVSNVNNLYGFQFEISYDSSILEFQNAQEGLFLNNNGQDTTFCVPYQSSPGLIKNIACTRLGSGDRSGSGTLETLTFKAVRTGQSTITLSNVKLADPNTNEITKTTSNGNVIVA